jgi:hypothetical protein
MAQMREFFAIAPPNTVRVQTGRAIARTGYAGRELDTERFVAPPGASALPWPALDAMSRAVMAREKHQGRT